MNTNIRHVTRTLNVVSSLIFAILIVYLYAIETRGSTFATWTENVVLGASSSMLTTISETNATLLNICRKNGHNSTQLAMPLVSFSLNGTTYAGSVFTAKNDFTIDNKILMGLVLIISLLFHMWRIFKCVGEECDDRVVDTLQSPDFGRWVEYTLTSPLQIIVICSTVYIRNISDITQLSVLQGALTLSGWTLEVLILSLQHFKSCTTHGHDGYCQGFYENLKRFAVTFIYATLCHVIIWWNIFSRYFAHEQNISSCMFGIIEIPSIVRTIVIMQCVLFSLFGSIPLLQVLYIVCTVRNDCTFISAAVAYAVLSVTSKGLLAIMFVKLITDGNCFYTNDGKACLT